MGRDAEGDITNHMIMAKTKSEETHLADSQKSPKKNRYRKNNKPKIHFGTIVSDRNKSQERTGNQNKRRNKPEK